jgi:hypothetical protein
VLSCEVPNFGVHPHRNTDTDAPDFVGLVADLLDFWWRQERGLVGLANKVGITNGDSH